MKVAQRTQCSWASKFSRSLETPPTGQFEERIPDIAGVSRFSASLASPTFTWSHTVPVGLTDSAVVIVVGHSGTGPASHVPTAVTYAGVAMTALSSAVAVNDGSNGTPRFQRWYYLLNPPAGASTVSVTMNSSTSVNVDCSGSNWQYVDQANPFGTPAVGQANTGTSVTASVSGTTPTDRILSCAVVRNVGPIPDGTLTYHDTWSYTTSTYFTLASKAGGGSESVFFSWSATNPPNNNTLVVVPIHGAVYEVDDTPVPPGDEWDLSIPAAYGGGTYTRNFFDDFDVNVPENGFLNNPAYSSKWDAYSIYYYMTNANPANGGSGNHYGGNGNLSVNNSELIMRCYRDSSTGKAVGCAPTMKMPGGSLYQQYGRYAVRFRVLENTAGWKVAWLLWNQLADYGTKPWPQAGEFDFLEGSMNSNMGAFHHWFNATNGSQQDFWDAQVPFSTGYHTVICEWTPNYVRVVIDGIEIGRRDASTPNGGTSRIVTDPMRAVLQTEVNLGGTQPGTPATMRIAIDKVAVWSWAA